MSWTCGIKVVVSTWTMAARGTVSVFAASRIRRCLMADLFWQIYKPKNNLGVNYKCGWIWKEVKAD